MNLTEALEWAADYAERNKLFAPVLNARGYADGWKPPTPQEKSEIIRQLAREVMESDNPPLSNIIGPVWVPTLSTLSVELEDIEANLRGSYSTLLADRLKRAVDSLYVITKEIRNASGNN